MEKANGGKPNIKMVDEINENIGISDLRPYQKEILKAFEEAKPNEYFFMLKGRSRTYICKGTKSDD